MVRISIVICLLVSVFGMTFSAKAIAKDYIITNPQSSSQDKRFDYPFILLNEVLKRTEKEYGAYELKRFPQTMSRNRALRSLLAGEIAVYSAPTRLEWEKEALPVRIPIRKGLLGYKLFLIRKDEQGLFDQIKTEQDLRKFRYGGGLQWSSSLALKKLGFETYGGADYEPLFAMLSANRFDYFPRGVNEIFTEYDIRKDVFPKLGIEESLALYLPSPTYFFVSPKYPALAQRIEKGMLALLKDGTFDKLFLDHHWDALKKAALHQRKIIRLSNPLLSEQTPFKKSEFWYQPKK